MSLSFIRTIILYISVILAMRIMGKRTIGEMHPTELVVSIMISDLATVPMQSKSAPLTDGIIPIFTLVVLELVFAYLVLKSRLIRRILVGHSCRVVRRGKLCEKQMRQLRVTVDDIEEQIRINGYTSLEEISEIVIETNGQVSVIAKKEASPVKIGDVDIEGEENITPFIVVADGKIRPRDLNEAKISVKDIEREMRKRKIKHIRDILYLSALDSKIICVQERDEKKNA
ncbi:MAG: DUF421 domain-containing protein [Clostridia bacterium]|nr:DUF421 domain-containing protein [Clostridia bacterium]